MKERIDRILQKMQDNHIQCNEVLSIQDVKQFEEKTGVKLPEELVLFYTTVCNGCVMIDGFGLKRLEEWIYDKNQLREDFPFEDYWIWEDDFDEERLKKITYGNLELLDIGDAQTWNIIVNGKERGKMWFFTDVGMQPCAPSMSFLEWFEFWLDGNEDYFSEFCQR